MSERLADEKPGVIHIKIYGATAVTVTQELELPEKTYDQELLKRYTREHDEEVSARVKAGLCAEIPERDLFKELHASGIPNVCVALLLHELFEDGYFLIAADHQIDDDERHRARLAFSRKPEDMPLRRESPSLNKILSVFEVKVWHFAYIHDRRRIHPGTGKQVGNNAIDLCGGLQSPDRCRTFQMLHFHTREDCRDGPYSYDHYQFT